MTRLARCVALDILSFLGVAGLFLGGIFYNAYFFWCHWLGFAGLWFLYQKSRKSFCQGFLVPCWLAFFVIYAAYLFWLFRYDFWVYLIGTLTLSLIFPIFFSIYHLVTRKFRSVVLSAIVAFGVFWFVEFALAHVPLTGTASVDFFFHAPIEILRILHFVHFEIWCAWLMVICYSAGLLMCQRSLKTLVIFFVSVMAMGTLIILADVGMRSEKKETRHTVKIALVQHNLPFYEEWRIEHFPEVRAKYETLALEAAKEHPDLIIFPQYTFPEDVYRNPSFFAELASKTRAYILVASHVPAESGKSVFDFGYMNMALLFTPEGKLGGKYQAMEEAPFGEIRQKSSIKYQVIEMPFGRLGVLLCYEDVTSKLAKEAVKAGANMLVSLSNPGMFLNTHMPYYHLQQDQLRAMEAGLPLARVSPNGYSAFIDRTGRIIQQTQLNAEDVLYIDY